MHVEQVLGNVPPSQRCRCHEEADEEGDKEGDVERDEERAAKETTAAGTAGFFSRLKDLIGK